MKAASVVFRKDDFIELESYEKLLAKVEGWLELCYGQNTDIVVFPALLGCIFDKSEEYVKDIVLLSSSYKDLAICPGSFYENYQGRTYHSSCIIMNGNIIMKQRQIYLTKWEERMGLSRGIELDNISLKGMKLGMLISTDAFYPQVSRALAMSGAELVLAPTAVKGGPNLPRQFAGLWQNVQANLFFGVESGFKGSFNKYAFHGNSIIHAPLEMTADGSGILASEEECRNDAVIIAELDNEKRKEAVIKFNTLAQLNTEAYESMFSAFPDGGRNG